MKKTVKTENLWIKCPSCDQIIYRKELLENFKICPKCATYLRMNSKERLEMLVDKKSDGALEFEEFDSNLTSRDPIEFEDPSMPYLAKLSQEKKKTKLFEAVVCGEGKIGGSQAVLAVLDFEFMGGSMGSVVGEKVTRAIERSLQKKIPLIIVSSSGGARMQEGILSLMQMAKTSAALAMLDRESILALSVLCDPTTGGVTASFAMLGDITIAEPKALIAFAGPRVIEQTIRQKLPDGFQQSEFLLKHGMVDCIVERKNLKSKIAGFLKFFGASTS